MALRLIPERPMNRAVAHHAKTQARVRHETTNVGSRAQGYLAGHRDTGRTTIEVEHHFEGRYGHVDGRISLNGNAVGDELAPYAIEFGHMNNRANRWVDGIHVLQRAARLL